MSITDQRILRVYGADRKLHRRRHDQFRHPDVRVLFEHGIGHEQGSTRRHVELYARESAESWRLTTPAERVVFDALEAEIDVDQIYRQVDFGRAEPSTESQEEKA